MDFHSIDELIKNKNLTNHLSTKSQQFWDQKINESKILFEEKPAENIKKENISLFLERLKKYNNIYLLFLINSCHLKMYSEIYTLKLIIQTKYMWLIFSVLFQRIKKNLILV